MMKEITVWECEYCKKLFKTPDKHKCKFNPELKNCFTCKRFIVWEDNFDGYISTTPHPECDIEASEGWDIENIKEVNYDMQCSGWEEGKSDDCSNTLEELMK